MLPSEVLVARLVSTGLLLLRLQNGEQSLQQLYIAVLGDLRKEVGDPGMGSAQVGHRAQDLCILVDRL
jgi:hypothetical protein